MICKRIPSSKPSVAHQHTALLTFPDRNLPPIWRQMPLIKDVFHPASYTVDHSLSGIQAKL